MGVGGIYVMGGSVICVSAYVCVVLCAVGVEGVSVFSSGESNASLYTIAKINKYSEFVVVCVYSGLYRGVYSGLYRCLYSPCIDACIYPITHSSFHHSFLISLLISYFYPFTHHTPYPSYCY